MGPGRTGTADLPLHGGQVPTWLSARMAKLGRLIVEAVVQEYGRTEVLRRLADPFWFQSFGAVMGMDWHSSGITTSVIGALKRGLAPVQDELGLHVCGGRGRHSRRTPDELLALGDRLGVDAGGLVRASRLCAKVDSAAVQDGFALYLHGFVVADDGAWVVVQQGMDTGRRQARRYHWSWDRASSFVEEPHAAIEGKPVGTIVNLTDRRAGDARAATWGLSVEGGERTVAELKKLASGVGTGGWPATARTLSLFDAPVAAERRLILPAHHDVRADDIDLARLGKTLHAVAEVGPRDFADLLLVPGVGARTVFALALVAEVIHGAPSRFADPARFSLAHGGKDGHPFPVPLKVYDRTLRVIKDAVERAKLGQDERMAALRRLDAQARVAARVARVDGDSGGGETAVAGSATSEVAVPTAGDVRRWMAAERAAAPLLGGRTVTTGSPSRSPRTAVAPPPARPVVTGQLSLELQSPRLRPRESRSPAPRRF